MKVSYFATGRLSAGGLREQIRFALDDVFLGFAEVSSVLLSWRFCMGRFARRIDACSGAHEFENLRVV